MARLCDRMQTCPETHLPMNMHLVHLLACEVHGEKLTIMIFSCRPCKVPHALLLTCSAETRTHGSELLMCTFVGNAPVWYLNALPPKPCRPV